MATTSVVRAKRNASSGSYKPGFYRALNSSSISTDLFQVNSASQSLRLQTDASELPTDCFLVERVIEKRRCKGKCEYLILWEGYPKEESSWIASEEITTAAIKSFESPTPSYRVIIDATSHFKAAIQRSLKSGMNCNNRLDIEFRTDVFRFLFKDKGRNPPTGRGLFYDIDDFEQTYFEDNWYVAYDRLGDGCSVDFPVRLESKIRWSPVVFNSDGSTKPRIFNEIISVTIVKIRC